MPIHLQTFHNLLRLFNYYSSFAIWIFPNEGSKPFFHFWECGLSAPFSFVDFDPAIPALEIFAVDIQFFGLETDHLRERLSSLLNSGDDLSHSFLLKFIRVCLIFGSFFGVPLF